MTGSAPTDYGFTGQRLDSSSALMYYGARYYDPVLGRFISADSIVPSAGNPQGLNRYAYVYNNPLRYRDPSGNWPWDDLWTWIQNMAGGSQATANSCAGSVDMTACRKPPKPISTSPFDYVRQIVHRAESGQQPRLEDPSAIHPVGPDIDRIIDAAAMAFQLGQQLQLTNDQAGALAERYETNPEAHVTVLGSSGVYEKTAEELGANAFEVEDPVWKGLTRGSQWDVNRAFLDRVIQRGDTIILASSYGCLFA